MAKKKSGYKRLSDEKRTEIKAELDAGVSVKELAKRHELSLPTIYNIKKSGAASSDSFSALEREVRDAKRRIAELKVLAGQIAALEKEVAAKEEMLKTLRTLQRKEPSA